MEDAERRLCLEALFAEHAANVLAYARRRASSAVADDVLSDVFLAAWRRLEDVPQDASPWLLACARSALRNHARGERRRVSLVSRLVAESAPGLSTERPDGSVAHALERLGERDRETLLLLAWEGLTAERAAVVVGCTAQTFRVRVHRARRRFARALRDADAAVDQRMTMEACND